MDFDPSDGWADLPYFLAVARTGSLRAAAERMGSTHATVRRRLSALESRFKLRLFDRSVDGLSLTPAGREILPRVEAAEREVLAARRQLSGLDMEAAGTVRISLPPWLAFDVMSPVFAEFSRSYPDIELDVMVTNRFQDLARHEVDVAVRVAYEVSDDVIGRRVLQYAKGLYASRDYIASSVRSAGPKGEGLHWIGWGDRDPLPDWIRSSPFPKATIRHQAREGMLQLHLVNHGMGMSYLPCYVEAFYPNLQRIPGTEAVLDRSIWLLLHADLRHTTRVRLLVEFLSDSLRSRRSIFLGPLA